MQVTGSEWRKWNFHVHTKGTNKNDQFSSRSMDDFFLVFYKKAVENNLAALGITDYFSIDRYFDALKYRAEIAEKFDDLGNRLFQDEEVELIKSMFIFPNVELRMLPSTDNGKLVNIHCLFNPDYVNDLENDFFGHIENQDRLKMNRHGITAYGRSLDGNIKEVDKQYKKGIDNFVIDLRTLTDLLAKNKRFRDNTLLVVSNSNKDGASALQKHYDLFENESGSLDGLRKSIYYMSDAVFSANPKDIKYFIGKRLEGSEGYDESVLKKEIDEVIKYRGSLKPCLVGCDGHTEEDLFLRYTWVKADLNFEGLRQICFEPEQRVKIQNEKPDFKEEKLLIDQVSFISPSKTFSTNPIYLNPNLNVIIGGKSSGKSILLFAIAKTLSPEESILKNEDGSYKYDLDKIDSDFDFQITTKGGFRQNLKRSLDVNSVLPQIKYIPQNYLVKLAEPELNKKGNTLNKLVRDLIIEDIESRQVYEEFESKLSQYDKSRNGKIDSYFELLQDVENLEVELKTKSNKDVLEKNIKTNTQKVEELSASTGLTEAEMATYKLLQQKLEANNARLQRFREDFSAIQIFNGDTLVLMKGLKQKKDAVIDQLGTVEIQTYFKGEYSEIDQLLQKINEIEKSLKTELKHNGKRFFVNESRLKEILTEINNESKLLNEEIKPYLKNEEIKNAIQLLNKSIAEDKKALQDIDSLSKRIVNKKRLLLETKDEIFNIYESSYQKYLDVIEVLKERTVELEKDGLEIVGKVKFNYERLQKEIFAISDGRRASYKTYEILAENRKATEELDFQTVLQDVKQLFEDILAKKYVLTNKSSIISAVKLVLYDYFFDYWEITYKNDKLGEMSTGKASFVILMLIIGLSKSKAPILIDQPEDNLDNRSITTDLVNYLRSKKLERQIIVVTHNANIVVNADAENIIVANQKGQNEELSSSAFKFDYINGAIENSFEKILEETDILKSMGIRQHIADIVEGGKDAFIKREKKYRFS